MPGRNHRRQPPPPGRSARFPTVVTGPAMALISIFPHDTVKISENLPPFHRRLRNLLPSFNTKAPGRLPAHRGCKRFSFNDFSGLTTPSCRSKPPPPSPTKTTGCRWVWARRNQIPGGRNRHNQTTRPANRGFRRRHFPTSQWPRPRRIPGRPGPAGAVRRHSWDKSPESWKNERVEITG